MSLASVSPFLWPHPFYGVGGLTGFTTILNESNDKAAFIMRAVRDVTIQKVGFRTGTVTTGGTLDIRVETVSAATGEPTGTLWAANTNGSQVVASTDDAAFFLTTLTSAAAINRSDVFAVVITNTSGAAGNLQIVATKSNNAQTFGYHGVYDDSSGLWNLFATGAFCLALEESGPAYYAAPYLAPFSTLDDVTINNGTTPDELGNRLILPFAARALGAFIDLPSASGATLNIKLYDSADTLLADSGTVDRDQARTGVTVIPFASSVALAAGSLYRLTALPATDTNIGIPSFSVPSNAMLAAHQGGSGVYRTHRTNAGSWTDTNTQRVLMGLVLDQLDDGAAGGGGGWFAGE